MLGTGESFVCGAWVFVNDQLSPQTAHILRWRCLLCRSCLTVSAFHICLAHHNRTIAIASDFRVDGAKSPEIPQIEGVLGSETAARNRKSLATFYCTLKSQCIIAVSCLVDRCDFWGPRWASQSQESQKSLRFRCAKHMCIHMTLWSRCRQRVLGFCQGGGAPVEPLCNERLRRAPVQ